MAGSNFFADLIPQNRPGGVSQKQRDEAAAKLAIARDLETKLNNAENLFNQTQRGNGILATIGEYLPTPANQAFNAAATQLFKPYQALTRVPGVGNEIGSTERISTAVIPSNMKTDAANAENFKTMRQTIENVRQQYGVLAQDPMTEAARLLRSNPSPMRQQQFDQVFGKGASARVLKGQ